MAEEIALNTYIDAIWRAKWLIIIVAAVAAGAVAFYRYRQPAVYTSQVSLQVGRVWKEPIEDPYVTAELVNSPGFLVDLAPKLGTKPGLVRKSIHATTITAGPQRSGYPILVSITATGNSSSEATTFAKVVAEEVIARHDLAFNQAMKAHLDYQKQLEAVLAPTGMLAGRQRNSESGQSGQGAAAQEAPQPAVSQPVVGSSAPAISEALARALHDYDEVRSFNASPAITQKTRLIAEPGPPAYSRAPIGSPAAIAGVLAALIVSAAAVVLAVLKNTQAGPLETTGRHASVAEIQDVADASIS